jgi:hypothetical protein
VSGVALSQVILPAIGLILLSAVLVDAFMTVFNPAEYGGPLSVRQNHVIWKIARRIGRRRGHRALSLAAPLMAVATIMLWIILLIIGFALIYLPWIKTFLVSPGALRSPLIESFYFSASTATTLSIGDMVPDLPLLRIIVPLETLAGVGLLTAVLQYMLSISQRAQAMAAVALDIAVHLGPKQNPDAVSDRIRRSGDASGWGEWCQQISRSLLGLWEAHTRYPILLYFHPVNQHEALSTQLGSLLHLRRAVLRGPDSGPLAQHPGFQAMCSSLELYLLAMDRHFLPGDDVADDEENKDLEKAYQRLLQETGYGDELRNAGHDVAESPAHPPKPKSS